MRLPFPMLGLDVDNDSAFINKTVVDYCKERCLELTRSRAYKKNDQAWIEQKNGAVVRRLVGYGRLEGAAAATALGNLHEIAPSKTPRLNWQLSGLGLLGSPTFEVLRPVFDSVLFQPLH
jgi:hypothetical protein